MERFVKFYETYSCEFLMKTHFFPVCLYIFTVARKILVILSLTHLLYSITGVKPRLSFYIEPHEWHAVLSQSGSVFHIIKLSVEELITKTLSLLKSVSFLLQIGASFIFHHKRRTVFDFLQRVPLIKKFVVL